MGNILIFNGMQQKRQLGGFYGRDRDLDELLLGAVGHESCPSNVPFSVYVLLAEGANVNATSKIDGDTVLHKALDRCELEIAKLLIANGANIHLSNHEGKTALHLASEMGHVEIVKLLLENGANVSAKSNGGYTALHLACSQGYLESCLEVAELLIEHGNTNLLEAKLQNGWTGLHLACGCWSQPKMVKLLLENGADRNPKAKGGMTPLHLACRRGFLRAITMMIENGADLTARDDRGKTPLHWACLHGHWRVLVKVLLIEHDIGGAEVVNAQDEQGKTLLHIACEKGRPDVAEVLLRRGANVNAKTTTEQGLLTPLHLAAEQNHPEVVWLLVRQYHQWLLVSEHITT